MPVRTGNNRKTARYRPQPVKQRRQAALQAELARARAAAGAPPTGQARSGPPWQRSISPSPGGTGGRGLGQNYQAGLGRQLSSRVASGAIDQEQAEHTAQERQQLENAYGPDWRRIVYGDRGYTQRTRKALAKNPESARLKALYENLMGRRKKLLEKAVG